MTNTAKMILLLGVMSSTNHGSAFAQPMAKVLQTTFDSGDSFGALGDRVAVAEDANGIVEIIRVSSGGQERYTLQTSYDRGGDRIALDGDYLFVAEDNGGLIEVYSVLESGPPLWAIPSSFDRNDGLAAAGGRVLVAEDDGGTVEVLDARTGRFLENFPTSYDQGDDVAAFGNLFMVAEDANGVVEVHNSVKSWAVSGRVDTPFDENDGLGVYMLGFGDGLLVFCTAEDDGGLVECQEYPLLPFFR